MRKADLNQCEWITDVLKEICVSGCLHLLLSVFICPLKSKDVQNYKVPNDAATGQLRNGHGTFLQGKHLCWVRIENWDQMAMEACVNEKRSIPKRLSLHLVAD